ncbi:inositol oxygenase [Chytridium lagenaria]|nr:inositol oxygenase [Chytridium lagenaria]
MTVIHKHAAGLISTDVAPVKNDSEVPKVVPKNTDGTEPAASIKKQEEFRNYTDSAEQARVSHFYALQHLHQTYSNVLTFESRHLTFTKFRMGCWDALEYLDRVVDDSDPDTSLTQIQHAVQSAEAARRKYPEWDWLHLVTLIHDLGKILAVTDKERGMVGDEQWAVVGDTFPVGCRFDESNIFHSAFDKNPDSRHPIYSTRLGIYKIQCGIDNLKMSWGHDEYLYQVLIHNNARIPAQGLSMIRYHSFYAWHTASGYRFFCNDEPRTPGPYPRSEDVGDTEKLKWVKLFNEFDLYSKADGVYDVKEVKEYYLGLMKKYLPEVLEW